MSAPQKARAVSPDDSHEQWCDQQWCGATSTGIEHVGRPNGWAVVTGDRPELFAHFELSLRRNDGLSPQEQPGRILTAFWMAPILTDSRVTEGAQVYLTPAQLRSTAQRMLAFAALADNVQGGGRNA